MIPPSRVSLGKGVVLDALLYPPVASELGLIRVENHFVHASVVDSDL